VEIFYAILPCYEKIGRGGESGVNKGLYWNLFQSMTPKKVVLFGRHTSISKARLPLTLDNGVNVNHANFQILENISGKYKKKSPLAHLPRVSLQYRLAQEGVEIILNMKPIKHTANYVWEKNRVDKIEGQVTGKITKLCGKNKIQWQK
jgi:hypothetical protein